MLWFGKVHPAQDIEFIDIILLIKGLGAVVQFKKSTQNIKMNELIEKFLSYMIENKGKSPQTVKNYRRLLERYYAYLLIICKEPDEVDPMEIEAYTGPVLSKEGMGAAGRSTAISAIRMFYRFCFRRGLLKRNPARDLEHPKRESSLPGILSLNDIEKLMFAPDLSTFSGLRDAAIMSFIFATGCRVSGLTSLNEDQLTYDGNEDPPRLYVILKEKGKKSRKLPINRKCEILLFSYLQHDRMKSIDRSVGKTKVVFVNLVNSVVTRDQWKGEKRRLTFKSIGEILKKHGRRVGIPEALLHPHAGRHTMGTMLYDQGLSVEDRMAWMGHASPNTLAKYTRLSQEKLLKAAREANPLSKVKTPIDALMKSIFRSDPVNKSR